VFWWLSQHPHGRPNLRNQDAVLQVNSARCVSEGKDNGNNGRGIEQGQPNTERVGDGYNCVVIPEFVSNGSEGKGKRSSRMRILYFEKQTARPDGRRHHAERCSGNVAFRPSALTPGPEAREGGMQGPPRWCVHAGRAKKPDLSRRGRLANSDFLCKALTAKVDCS
jgi:hypothetical protein